MKLLAFCAFALVSARPLTVQYEQIELDNVSSNEEINLAKGRTDIFGKLLNDLTAVFAHVDGIAGHIRRHKNVQKKHRKKHGKQHKKSGHKKHLRKHRKHRHGKHNGKHHKHHKAHHKHHGKHHSKYHNQQRKQENKQTHWEMFFSLKELLSCSCKKMWSLF